MADTLKLQLEPRTVTGKQVNQLRRQGILPATVYGKGVGPFTVQLDARTFGDVLRKAGRTTLVELELPGQPQRSAFIHALQRHPVRRDVTHVDFRVVDLRVSLTVDVPVHAVGESPLVKLNGAILSQVLATVTVSALPADIPSHIDADVSVLDHVDKSIYVRDLIAPDKGTIVSPEDEVVFALTPARVAEPTEEAEPIEPQRVGDEETSDQE